MDLNRHLRLKKFYTAKCEVANEDNSEEEEDEVLDFTKQKSEIIFWNDPRMGMKKKDITLSSLAKSMGIMTIMVTDTEEDKKVKEDRVKLKEVEEEAGPLERWTLLMEMESDIHSINSFNNCLPFAQKECFLVNAIFGSMVGGGGSGKH